MYICIPYLFRVFNYVIQSKMARRNVGMHHRLDRKPLLHPHHILPVSRSQRTYCAPSLVRLAKKKKTWEDRHQAIIQKFSAVIAFLHIILVDHCFFCLSCLAGIKENEIALRIKPSKRPRRNRRAGWVAFGSLFLAKWVSRFGDSIFLVLLSSEREKKFCFAGVRFLTISTHTNFFRQGGDPLKRNENDAAALQAKIAAKKAAQESASNAPTSSGPVPRKKVPTKKADNMDDLLSSGLTAGKKRVK